MVTTIYFVWVAVFFAVVKLVTTYGKKKTNRYNYNTYNYEEVPGNFTALKKMPLPRLLCIVIIGFIPIVNAVLAIAGFIYLAWHGYGPTGADIGAWFAGKFKKSGKV